MERVCTELDGEMYRHRRGGRSEDGKVLGGVVSSIEEGFEEGGRGSGGSASRELGQRERDERRAG